MGLFQLGAFALHSGDDSKWKIECDALTDDDWVTLAYLIQDRCSFRKVVGVPTGGLALARALEQYAQPSTSLPILIVDDVLTTGKSMEECKAQFPNEVVIGHVAFARDECPVWIDPLFDFVD